MKTILLTAAVLLGLLPSVHAYSLGGPIANGGDAWQVTTIDYGIGGDLNAPKNLGEEYRRNTPVMYYTYDQTFNDYFGAAGIASIDQAFTILNETFTNSPLGPTRGLDGYSADLAEFPIETRHINYEAKALGILDFKSFTLALMTEQLGLTDPVRYAWCLHDRVLPNGGTCPADEEYEVIMRNFDVISSPLNEIQYSPYVNDVLYTYTIEEFCNSPVPPQALTVPAPVDPLADTYSALAAFRSGSVYWGDFYSGYTRDDVAGFRYLMQSNNVNYESVPVNSLLYAIDTNTTTPEVFPPYIVGATNFVGTNGYYVFTGNGTNGYGYGDYAAFLAFITTNSPAQVEASYPGVVIDSVSNSFTIVSNETITAYFTNYVGSPYGSPPVLVLKTNYTPVFEFLYYYTFANIITNHFGPLTSYLISSTVSTPVGAPYGSAGVTNSTIVKKTYLGGDFFVLPPFYTNVCPIDILSKSSTVKTVLAYTNGFELLLTNSAASNMVSEVYEVTYFTNYSYVIYPVTCSVIADDTEYFQGIEKIQFVKVPPENYNTALGAFTVPITNNYTLIAQVYTNGQTVLEPRHFQRILTIPDILFAAEDEAAGAAGNVIGFGTTVALRDIPFDQAHVLAGLAGPGTIGTTANTLITWNKSGPVYFNTPASGMNGTPYFTETPGGDMADGFYDLYFLMGSFDGSTNAPTVFPDGTSIVDLENQVLVSISPTSVPNGSLSLPYPNIQFSASGGSVQQPFTWSATGLPYGLSLSTNGLLSGTPQQTGTFYFTITLTDVNGLSVQWYYDLIIQ